MIYLYKTKDGFGFLRSGMFWELLVEEFSMKMIETPVKIDCIGDVIKNIRPLDINGFLDMNYERAKKIISSKFPGENLDFVFLRRQEISKAVKNSVKRKFRYPMYLLLCFLRDEYKISDRVLIRKIKIFENYLSSEEGNFLCINWVILGICNKIPESLKNLINKKVCKQI